MKKLMLLLAIVLLAGEAVTQTTEFIQQKDFQAEKKKIFEGINATKKQLNEIKKADAKFAQTIDSVKKIITLQEGQLAVKSDSLAKTNDRVNSLKEQFDGQKLLSRGFLILLFIIILILFICAFLMLFLYKNRADANHQLLIDLDKKTNSRIDMEITDLKNDVQSNFEAVNALSSDLNYKISTALTSIEGKNLLFEKQMKDDVSGIDLNINSLVAEISTLKAEQTLAAKSNEASIHALRQEFDLVNQRVEARSVKIENEMKSLKGKQ